MDLNKAVEHCWDRRDYPEIISDDAGYLFLDLSLEAHGENIIVLEELL